MPGRLYVTGRSMQAAVKGSGSPTPPQPARLLAGLAAGISTLVDDFEDNTVNTVLWATVGGGAQEIGGRARIPNDTPFALYESDDIYQFDSIYWRAYLPATNGATTNTFVDMKITSTAQRAIDSGTYIIFAFDVVTQQLKLQSRVGFADGGTVTLTYSPSDHAWMRLVRSGGNVTFDTAPDSSGIPGPWTTQRTIAAPAWTGNSDHFFTIESHRTDGIANYAELENVNTGILVVLPELVMANRSY